LQPEVTGSIPVRSITVPPTLRQRRVAKPLDSRRATESVGSPLTLRPRKRRETEARMGILWIILVVVVVLALLGFVGRAL
jgi:type VI protein secretion system component VasF